MFENLLEIFIYIPDGQLIIGIQEGDGSLMDIAYDKYELFPEEKPKDYLTYDIYRLGHMMDNQTVEPLDGGMIDLPQLMPDEFSSKEEVIACVLDFIFEGQGSKVKYQIINTKGANKEWPTKKK